MNKDFVNTPARLREAAAEMVRLATAAGADAAEAAASESMSMEVSVRNGALDGMDIGREQDVSVSVYLNGGQGTASIGNLNAASLREAVERAVAIARAAAPDPYAGLADAALMATEFPELDLYHPWALAADDAIALARRGEEAAWAVGGAISREKSEGASVHTGAELSAYANSHGFCAAEKSTAHSLSVVAIAEKDGEMERDGWHETMRNADALPSPEDVGRQAGERAARRLGGGKIGDGRAAVLFQAPVSHSLIGHFVGAASGGALYRKMSWLLDRLNQPIFPSFITIRERPHLPRALNSAAYDGDGVATRERDVVKDGVWCGCFLSAYSARRLGMESTANAGGSHNLEVAGETVAAAEMMKTLGRGLLVTDLMGQGVNSVTGDYSRGASGFWVEDGEIAYPLSEITVAGNLSDMLPAIAAVGDDTMRRRLVACGSLLIPDMAIGGNK